MVVPGHDEGSVLLAGGEPVHLALEVPVVGAVPEVAAAPVGGVEAEAGHLEPPEVVSGVLEALVVHRPLPGVSSQLLRRGLGAHGEELPQFTPLVGDHLDGLVLCLGVAEGELQAVGVLLGEEPLLVALHGPAEGDPGADGVDAQPVAEIHGLVDVGEVAYPAVGAEGVDALELDAGQHRPLGVLLDQGDVVAADGAARAGDGLHHPPGVDVLSAYLLGELEDGLLPVPGGEGGLVLVDHDAHLGAEAPVGSREGALAEVVELLAVLQGALHVGDLDASRAPHGDGLEVLGAHDAADAGPTRLAVPVVCDVGVPDEVLPGGSDGGRADVVVSDLLLDEVEDLQGVGAPEVLGVPDLDLPVVDEQVDGLLALPLDDYGVVSRLLEGLPPVA